MITSVATSQIFERKLWPNSNKTQKAGNTKCHHEREEKKRKKHPNNLDPKRMETPTKFTKWRLETSPKLS